MILNLYKEYYNILGIDLNILESKMKYFTNESIDNNGQINGLNIKNLLNKNEDKNEYSSLNFNSLNDSNELKNVKNEYLELDKEYDEFVEEDFEDINEDCKID